MEELRKKYSDVGVSWPWQHNAVKIECVQSKSRGHLTRRASLQDLDNHLPPPHVHWHNGYHHFQTDILSKCSTFLNVHLNGVVQNGNRVCK